MDLAFTHAPDCKHCAAHASVLDFGCRGCQVRYISRLPEDQRKARYREAFLSYGQEAADELVREVKAYAASVRGVG